MDLFDLTGKVAVVTGGTRGIGLMMARGLLQAGASVYISSRKAEAGDAAGHPGAVGGPGHDVRGARHDLLVTPGAAVRLGRSRARDAADGPVAVRP